jgi:hypothetical protein
MLAEIARLSVGDRVKVQWEYENRKRALAIEKLATAGPAGANLLVNGGFETGDASGWQRGGYGAFVFEAVAAAARSGRFGLRMTRQGGQLSLGAIAESIGGPLEPGATYVFSFAYRSPAPAASPTCSVAMPGVKRVPLTATAAWQVFTSEFVWTPVAMPRGHCISIQMGCGDELHVDDCVLTRKGAASLVANGDFETGAVDPWKGRYQEAMEIARGDAHGGEFAMRVRDDFSCVKVPLAPGERYVVEFWVKGLEPWSGELKAWGKGGGTLVRLDPVPLEWRQFRQPFTVKEPVNELIWHMRGRAKGDGMLVDDFRLAPEADFAAAAAPAGPVAGNVVVNGGFETGDTSGWECVRHGGQRTALELQDEEARSGKWSLVYKPYSAVRQTLRLTPGMGYDVSYWVKVVRTNENGQTGGVSIDVPRGKEQIIREPCDWRRISMEFRATKAEHVVYVWMNKGDGQVYIDDVSVTPIDANLVANGGFETGTTEGWAVLSGNPKLEVVTQTPAEGRYCLKPGGGGSFGQTVTVEPGKTYRLSCKVMNLGVRNWGGGIGLRVDAGTGGATRKGVAQAQDTDGWMELVIDFTAERAEHTVTFGLDFTNFLLDDVGVVPAGGAAAAGRGAPPD